MDIRDLKQILKTRIENADTYSEIYTICEFAKDICYQENLNEGE